MKDPIAALRKAVAHLESAEPEPALDALLDAWRASKGDPKIADAIDLLSARLTEKEAPIGEVGSVSEEKAWNAAFKSGRPAVMERLLDAIVGTRSCNRRLGLIAELPPDPRVTSRLRKWLLSPPVNGSKRLPFFIALAKLVKHAGDVRLLGVLEAVVPNGGYWTFGLTGYKALKTHTITLKKKKLAPLSAEGQKLIARITSEPKAVPEPLFNRVYADPSDNDARAVLADLLQQRGDPRGEFIALQLSRHGTEKAPTKEEKKLEQTWARPWLGALDAATEKAGIVYERGFVTQCQWKGGAENAIEWSTVTHVDVSPATIKRLSSVPMLMAPNAKHIRHVRGLRGVEREFLEAATKSLPWETVGWCIQLWDEIGPIMEGPGKLFSAARVLAIGAGGSTHVFPSQRVEHFAGLLERWPQVTEFEIPTSLENAMPLLRAVPRLQRVRVGESDDCFDVDLAKKTLRCELYWKDSEPPPAVAKIARQLQLKVITAS